MKTLNLQKSSKGLHDACPYCLEPISEPEDNTELEDDASSETKGEEEHLIQSEKKSSDCKYHFGYLSEKERKQQIPDECIICPEIIDCMIKK